MKIHWFSPLPPEKTEIAHCTARLLPALTKIADVVLWTDQSRWDPKLERHARVRAYSETDIAWEILNRDGICFYNIGNHALFHRGIWHVARQRSGIVILHDLCRHHFLAGMLLTGKQDPARYAALMRHASGTPGRMCTRGAAQGRETIDDVGAWYPLTDPAIENAAGVVVHTGDAFDRLSAQTRKPLCRTPLPYAASQAVEAVMDKYTSAAIGDEAPLRLVVFGHIRRNRCLDQVIRALAAFPDNERLRLDIYGEVWDPDYISGWIAREGVAHLVSLHGVVSERRLTEALSSAHLAVNLRDPTMGEASGGQLKIWDHALPSLVTRSGWFADIPDDVVGFVRPGKEVEDIGRQLEKMISAPESFGSMGLAGRKLLEARHSPEAYAEVLVDFAKDTSRLSGVTAAEVFARQSAPAIASCMTSETKNCICDRLANVIHDLTRRSKIISIC